MSTGTNGTAPAWQPTKVLERLTVARMSSYTDAFPHDLVAAFDLYEWNLDAAGALLGTLGMAEVVVRNSLDSELRRWAAATGSASWFDRVPLDSLGRHSLDKARDRATSHGRRPELPDRVVAELPLGFWRYLTTSRYLTSLWVPALHSAFPNGPADLRARRAAVERRLDRLLFVRNRVAHHEPVHRRDLQADLGAAADLVGWVCPDSAAWLSATSSVSEVTRRRPVG